MSDSGYTPSPEQEFLHVECDCVPDDGPSHCHLCGELKGSITGWPCEYAEAMAAHDAAIRKDQAERDIAIVNQLYPLGSEVLGNAPMVIAVALRSQSFTGTEEQNG